MHEGKIHFDEFKLFYESTEKVVDRRLSANKWNNTISTAILFSIGLILKWAVTSPDFFLPAILIILILCIMAIIHSTFWIAQIKDFKQLNNVKFQVLNNMAPCIAFSETNDDSRVSFRPFEKEWDILQKVEAVEKSSNSKLITFKSSKMEYFIPKSFRVLYIFIIIMIFSLSVYNWERLLHVNTYKLQHEIKK